MLDRDENTCSEGEPLTICAYDAKVKATKLTEEDGLKRATQLAAQPQCEKGYGTIYP